VRFRRTRGTSADVSQVTLPVSGGFTWRAPERKDYIEPIGAEPAPPAVAAVLAPTFGGATAGAIELPEFLEWSGDLVLGEDASQLLVVPGLFITKVQRERIDTPTGEPLDVVKLTLADQRLFWARGAVSRHSYNVIRADGTVRKDTLRGTVAPAEGAAPAQAGAPDEPVPLSEIAADVVKSLPFQPSLGRVPAEWLSDRREVKFRPHELAARAAVQLGTLGEAVEPCLDLDGRVSFYRPGEGAIGWAADGSGPNVNPIPGEETTGAGFDREALFPEQWLLVVGEERVASVALDDAEPVLWVNGSAVLLSEEAVRELTGGRYGLDWLRKVVVLPGIDHGADGVPAEVVDLLAKQAWRFYRVRGLEKIEAGKYTGEPGPNAHLLPLLDRAELDGARRRGVTIEAYKWETRHERAATQQTDKLSAANQALATITRRLRDLSNEIGANPLDDGNPRVARDGINVAGLTAGQMLGGLLPFDQKDLIDTEQVDRYLKVLRRVELLKEQGRDAFAEEYLSAYRDKVAAINENDPGASENFALAQQLAKFEKENAEALNFLVTGDEQALAQLREVYGPQIDRAARDAAAKIAAAKESAAADAAAREAGFDPRKSHEIVYLSNLPREIDAGARVVSRELGVVRTSGLAGWVADQAVGHPAQTEFVPRAVRVTFGATLRPRIDVAPGQVLDRVTTGGLAERAASGGGQDVVPADVLSEAASVYRSAWLRTAQGRVEPVALEDVPLHMASVARKRWRELIPLPPGVSNRAKLDGDARKLALSLSKRPERLESRTVEAAGPWAVQCDGVVAGVSIVMEQNRGVPCGFTTVVDVGGEGTVDVRQGTRERGA
jgi:hypothetical protein